MARMSNGSPDLSEPEAPPLAGVKVVEFTHMVMGPSVGVILADLGAEVIKVEPIGGDPTRRLLGSGAGYFPMFNRNKRSVCLDLKSPDGLVLARRLVDAADVMIENYRPGTLERLGLGPDTFKASNPGLIACSAKGFLSGPYEQRTALDEVTQMMGGLAYMTGPPGRPLRAGASVIDITGGMFGAIGILAALHRRDRTGRGADVRCSLFETTAFLVGQHMAQQAVTGEPAQPMPVRVSAWAIYDVFETLRAEEQLFVGVVSDAQWRSFVEAFDLGDVGANSAFATNNARVMARHEILPVVRALFETLPREALVAELERLGLPFAPIARPDDLFEDAHLNAAGGLLNVTIPGGEATKLPGLPIEVDGRRFGLTRDIPAIGADTEPVFAELGMAETELAALRARGVVQ
jgi:crotonobetainyl-CoA:carnitine CoA-transferase CaiB-like acyl-CoA transferase